MDNNDINMLTRGDWTAEFGMVWDVGVASNRPGPPLLYRMQQGLSFCQNQSFKVRF